ncbi:MAG: hypothetical protein H0U21_12910 [Acidimicrobiia bacterium]|nr:hypothetical protein [Acidimicrobiia bacterium]
MSERVFERANKHCDEEFPSLIQTVAGVFDPSSLADQAEPVRRHLAHAIAAGTPIASTVRVEMRGHIKLGRWMPFRATELLNAPRVVWRARVAGVITGSDRYVDERGTMSWKLGGIVPLMHAGGSDVSRSAAGRAGGEAQWVPTSLLPSGGVTWTAADHDHITSRHQLNGVPIEVRHQIDDRGNIVSTAFDRWGDPDRTGTWGWHRFGGEVTACRTFGGYCIPSAGRIGWHYGTGRWLDGEFFRYTITALQPVLGASGNRPVLRTARRTAVP